MNSTFQLPKWIFNAQDYIPLQECLRVTSWAKEVPMPVTEVGMLVRGMRVAGLKYFPQAKLRSLQSMVSEDRFWFAIVRKWGEIREYIFK